MNPFQHRKRLAYVNTFLGPDGKPHPEAVRVLADLKRFCNQHDTGLKVGVVSRMVDPYATIYAVGLADVYKRILMMIGLNDFVEPQPEKDNARSSSADR